MHGEKSAHMEGEASVDFNDTIDTTTSSALMVSKKPKTDGYKYQRTLIQQVMSVNNPF